MIPIPGGTLHPLAAEGAAQSSAEGAGIPIAPFHLSATEVTWDAFDVFVFRFDEKEGAPKIDAVTRPTKPYIAADRGFGHNGYPAVSISFRGAQAFCEWLSAKTGRRYRLPTEHEWEWAARAGTTSRWSFGDDEEELDRHAWHRTNSDLKTHPVGQKEASPWGLYDVYGNVSEWCVGADGAPVMRGGAYSDRADVNDASVRKPPSPAWNRSDPQLPKSVWWLADGPFAGFRIVCEDEPAAPENGE